MYALRSYYAAHRLLHRPGWPAFRLLLRRARTRITSYNVCYTKLLDGTGKLLEPAQQARELEAHGAAGVALGLGESGGEERDGGGLGASTEGEEDERRGQTRRHGERAAGPDELTESARGLSLVEQTSSDLTVVITSYSIHYTKLYEVAGEV